MTNLEAIRRMDVWDLAEKLVEWTVCECENCPAADNCDISGAEVLAENCEIELKVWLETENKPYKPKKLSEIFGTPTAKQLAYIADIEEYLGVEFKGSTKAEATAWLVDFAPIYRLELALDCEARNEMVDARRDW